MRATQIQHERKEGYRTRCAAHPIQIARPSCMQGIVLCAMIDSCMQCGGRGTAEAATNVQE